MIGREITGKRNGEKSKSHLFGKEGVLTPLCGATPVKRFGPDHPLRTPFRIYEEEPHRWGEAEDVSSIPSDRICKSCSNLVDKE